MEVKNKKRLRLFVAILLVAQLFSQAIAATPDPGIVGPYTVISQIYDFGDQAFTPANYDAVEVRGKVFYPSNLSAGPFPLIILVHGRHEICYQSGSNTAYAAWPCSSGDNEIPNYLGYDYLAQRLASHGYIVVSIGANGIYPSENMTGEYGMQARAELVQHHLNLWKQFNTTGGTPFGNTFVGKVDLSKVGTMGHSRGGEGVVQNALYNKSLGSPYGIKAVLAVAPTNFNRYVLNGVALGVVLPYCDGDVYSLAGLHYYDDTRYSDPADEAPKHTLLMMGANHNFFNSIWTPGQFVAGTADDWDDYLSNGAYDPHCGSAASGNKRFDEAKQKAALMSYACAFFRVYVGGEKQFAPILEAEDPITPASSTLSGPEIHISYHPPSSKRIDVNRMIGQLSKVTNTMTDSAKQSGLSNYTVCGDATANQFCLGVSNAQEPHDNYGNTQQLGLSQLELEWNNSNGWYENKLPSKYKNLSQFHSIQFRASVNFATSPLNQAMDFDVQLRTVSGATQTIRVSDYSNALFFPPGTLTGYVPKIIHNTIKIPLSKFNSIDLSKVAAIRFKFSESSVGAIIVSDLLLSSDSIIQLPPSAAFSSNALSTCDGTISFLDQSSNNPAKWIWDFGDGTSSNNQNPIHSYATNGNYTVKEVVSNSSGKDSLVKTSAITVSKPLGPTVVNDQRSAPGVVNLSATALAGGTLEWYDAPSGGNKVFTGNNYSVNLNVTTSYYVQEAGAGAPIVGGKMDNSTGGGGYLNNEQGLYFNVLQACTLKTVTVYASGAGDRTIELRDSTGAVAQTATITIPNGTQKINLNFALKPGRNYGLWATNANTVNLYRNNDGVGVSYPYAIGTAISITNSTAASTTPENYYYYFYNWEIQQAICISTRTVVTGTIGITGISVNTGDSGLKIYPNPVSNSVTVEKGLGAEPNLQIELINILGERIQTFTMEGVGIISKTISMENLPSGIYFISVKGKNSSEVFKLVKE